MPAVFDRSFDLLESLVLASLIVSMLDNVKVHVHGRYGRARCWRIARSAYAHITSTSSNNHVGGTLQETFIHS